MCGRFALSISVSDLPHPLRKQMGAEHQRRYAPRQLISPGEPVLALRRDQAGPESALMLWGLIPSWSKDPTQGPRPINAPKAPRHPFSEPNTVVKPMTHQDSRHRWKTTS